MPSGSLPASPAASATSSTLPSFPALLALKTFTNPMGRVTTLNSTVPKALAGSWLHISQATIALPRFFQASAASPGA
jgi:hypothetical protein